MLVQAFPSGPLSTNAYVAACPETREAAIIDPAPNSSKAIQAFLASRQLKCRKILLTHSHWDHIADVKELKEVFTVPIYIHPLDAPNLRQPGSDGLPCWLNLSGVEPDILLEDGMQIPLGGMTFQVLHTPGHSPGGVCFYNSQHKVLFSGDTLFQGTFGSLSLPTSQPALMQPSLAKLAQLPSGTTVYPGHGSPTTIGAESTWLSDAKELFDY
jgi:hydroxyacylglutathione hydrolase